MTKPILPIWLVSVCLGIVLALYIFEMIRNRNKLSKRIFGLVRLVLMLTLVFVVNLRIMTKHYNTKVETKNIDILFVLDTTISMYADDYPSDTTRMKHALDDCAYITEEMSGCNFALVRFDNRSQVLAPFTQDATCIRDAFSTITPLDYYYAKGSSLNIPYEDMESLLISSYNKPDQTTILFFISDGEITDESTLRDFSALSQYVDSGAVLGYGTEEGASMTYSMSGVSYTMKDPETGLDAISKLDKENLTKLAADLEIDYIQMDKQSNVTYLLDAIKAGSASNISDDNKASYEDTYYYYLIPLGALLLLEAYLLIRRKHF